VFASIHHWYGWIHHWYGLIHQGGLFAAVVGFLLIVFVSFVPLLPIPLIAGAVGAVIPLVPAILSTWAGACVGALLKFFIERLLLRRPAQLWLRRYESWQGLVGFLDRNGFYAVLVTRLIPVFPSSLVNTAGAVTGISVRAFVFATLIGKLPTMVVFTVAGAQITTHFWRTMGWLSVYGVAVGLATWWLGRTLHRRTGASSGATVEYPERVIPEVTAEKRTPGTENGGDDQ